MSKKMNYFDLIAIDDESDSETGVSMSRKLTPLKQHSKTVTTESKLVKLDKKELTESYLEITLNHPQTKRFLAMNSTKQKALYCSIWNCIKNEFQLDGTSAYIYEYTKLGQVHLHGYIKLPPGNFFIAGAISDIVKRYLNLLPKKYSLYNSNNYYPEYDRYRCPSICVQYTNDISAWKDYMAKDQSYIN